MTSPRALELATFIASFAAAALAFSLAPEERLERRPMSASLLSLVPKDASLVVSINVKKLRTSALGKALLGETNSLPGADEVPEICGFDPEKLVEELVLVSPVRAGSMTPSFDQVSVLALGPFTTEQISACAMSVITRRGGSAAVTRVGSFASVRDRSQPEAELAVRDGGPVLLGSGPFLRELIDVADTRAPALSTDNPHRKLRTALGSESTLLVSLILPPGWLEELADSKLVRLSPLSTVRAAALRIDLGERLQARALLACAGPEPCAESAALIERLVASEFAEFLDGELGPNGSKRIRVAARDSELEATLWLEEREASALAARAIEALTRRREPALDSAPALQPDEIVRPP